MFFICLKIFFARILDVSISTFRTLIMVRGEKLLSVVLAFFEVFIWFYAARTALMTNINSIYLPISYSLGYATGSFIGMTLSSKFIKGIKLVQVITSKNSNNLIKLIKENDIGVTEIKLKDKDKFMLYIQVNSYNLKKLYNLILKYDENAFLSVIETKNIINGWIK